MYMYMIFGLVDAEFGDYLLGDSSFCLPFVLILYGYEVDFFSPFAFDCLC